MHITSLILVFIHLLLGWTELAFAPSICYVRQNQLNLSVCGQESIKNTVGKINFLLFNSYGWHCEKKKNFFSVNKKEKSVIVSVQSIYSLDNKTEEHSGKVIWISNQIIFVLLCNNIGFSIW